MHSTLGASRIALPPAPGLRKAGQGLAATNIYSRLPSPGQARRAVIVATVAAAAAAVNGGEALAATLQVSPDDGLLSLDGGSFVQQLVFNGNILRAGALSGGVREFQVLGDLNVRAGDLLTLRDGPSNAAVRFVVGNNARIDGLVNFSGLNGDLLGSGSSRGGGGGGGLGGTPNGPSGRIPSMGQGGAAGFAGPGGLGNNAFFVNPDFVNVQWVNATLPIAALGGGLSGTAGLGGGRGNNGSSGTYGGSGGGGTPGLNDNRPLGFGAGGGGVGGGGSGTGLGGAGGFAGVGGGGGAAERLQFNTIIGGLSPTGLTQSAAAGAGQPGERAQPGLNGQAGADGRAGGGGGTVGSRTFLPVAGRGTAARDSVFLIGGYGGGGGGAGGTGQNGGDGGGGGGGGAGGGGGGAQMCDAYLIFFCGVSGLWFTPAMAFAGADRVYSPGIDSGPANGGAGGSGGSGASGGLGGLGGPGGVGGDGGGGGGAVEIAARGLISVNGSVLARGGNGTRGEAGLPGVAGLDARDGDRGSPGGSSGRNAAAGGNGRDGGRSGMGGTGGTGGIGGGGAGGGGGTVLLVGAELQLPGAISAAGGSGGAGGGATGVRGNVLLGSNKSLDTRPENSLWLVEDSSGQAAGSKRANPYVRDNNGGSVQTPYLTDQLALFADGSRIGLEGGADAFGRLSASTGQAVEALATFIDGLRANSPGSGVVVLRLDQVFGNDYLNADHLLVANLGQSTLEGLSLGVTTGAADPAGGASLEALALGGWQRDPAFGGSGVEELMLRPGEVWLTLVPGDAQLTVGWVARGVAPGSGQLLTAGLGLTFTTPVPEPSTWALLLGGLVTLGAVARRRRMSGARTCSP